MKSKFSFSKLLIILMILLLAISSFGQKRKFKNGEYFSYLQESDSLEWYGEVKNGMAEGFGFLAKDTMTHKKYKLYQSVFFKEGNLLPDSFLINRNLKVTLQGDTSLNREPFCSVLYRFDSNVSNSGSNSKFVLEYNTSQKVYGLYGLDLSSGMPHYLLRIFDKHSGITTRYGRDCYLNTYVETRKGTGDWVKTLDPTLSISQPGKLENEIREMLDVAIATNNRQVFYILFSQLCHAYGDQSGAFQSHPIDTEFIPKYKSLMEEAGKWTVPTSFNNLFQQVGYDDLGFRKFIKELVKRNESNYQNEKETERARQSGLNIRYTFNNDVIGKRYVPPITKRYTATVGEFYINGERIKITEDKTSTMGGYDENQMGYIGIYQLTNTSDDYLIVPLSITGTSKSTKLTVITFGFFNNKRDWGKISSKSPFEIKRTFLLDPRSSVKDQLVTGEEIPSDFRIAAGEILKVDLNWVTRLSRALEGDPASLDQMLADKRAVYWQDELKEMKNKLTIKAYAPLLDISLVPVNKLTFDPDFDSEVVLTIRNRSPKFLEISYSTSIGKKGMEFLASGAKAERKFNVKGQAVESLKATIDRLTVSSGADISRVTDIDGNSYKTTVIGHQIWMAENLRATRFNDGTAIPVVTDSASWSKTSTTARCWFKNDETVNREHGALYNGYVAVTGKICPPGWHLPTNEEWELLEEYVNHDDSPLRSNNPIRWLPPDVEGFIGKEVKSTNEYGFNGYPVGTRFDNGSFQYRGKRVQYWSASGSKWNRNKELRYGCSEYLFYLSNRISVQDMSGIGEGSCIRCLRD